MFDLVPKRRHFLLFGHTSTGLIWCTRMDFYAYPSRGRVQFIDDVVAGPGPLRGLSPGLQPGVMNVALSGLVV
jgi:hypothetical protein